MERAIVGYHLDEANDWVAELDCLHGQHIRHNPPFTNRSWATTEAGRKSMLGRKLHCVRCDRLELPDGLHAYKRTPEFNELTIPQGVLKNHSTKTGTWGIIQVLDGQLSYTVAYPETKDFILTSTDKGIVVPGMLHRVKPLGQVRFYVEFFSR